jgi:hypothetical protein
MIKTSQLFGWEQEPVDERPSEFMPSTGFGTLSGYHANLGNDSSVVSPQPSRPANWVARRDPPSHRDNALSQIARAWFESLPVPLRPRHLCVHYPRIANRLALCWPDLALTQRLFERLMVDNRGGRQGFPTEVAGELAQLHRFAARREVPM